MLRRFSEMLENPSRTALPGLGTDRGVLNHRVQDANPEPGQTAPGAMLGPAPESTPDPGGIDITLWDRGIDGLLQERVPAGSERHRSESGALWAAAFLASGLVGSELYRRRPAGSHWARKPRRRPAGAASPPR